jgi:hypothetical protein
MIKALNVTLKSEDFLDTFTGQGTVCFVDQTSFNAEVNQYAQDHQFIFMIVKHFILPALKTKKENIEHWANVIFKGCRTRKQLRLFCQNFLAALPEDESAAVRWVEYLLKNHPDSLVVEVACQASADSHQMQYNK